MHIPQAIAFIKRYQVKVNK